MGSGRYDDQDQQRGGCNQQAALDRAQRRCERQQSINTNKSNDTHHQFNLMAPWGIDS
jgi:hypothetical protein